MIVRAGYLALNLKHMILAEERKEGVNDDRIPVGGIRVKVLPGEDLILEGKDAADFRRQLDEFFPRETTVLAEVIHGQPYDPETGQPLPLPRRAEERG